MHALGVERKIGASHAATRSVVVQGLEVGMKAEKHIQRHILSQRAANRAGTHSAGEAIGACFDARTEALHRGKVRREVHTDERCGALL